MRRNGGCGRRRRRDILSNVVASQAELHAPIRRHRSRGGLAATSDNHRPGRQAGTGRCGPGAWRARRRCGDVRALVSPARSSSASIRPRAWRSPTTSRFEESTILKGTSTRLGSEDVDPEQNPGFPLACLIASGGHTDLINHGGTRPLHAYRKNSGRRCRRGFRQGGPGPGSRFPGGPAIQRCRHRKQERSPVSRGLV